MYKVSVNGNNPITAEIKTNNQTVSGSLNGKSIQADIIKTGTGEFHLLYNNKSYNVIIVRADFSEKKLTLKLNGKKFSVEVKDRFDELLHTLGMDNAAAKKVNDIKAPMPGMVLNILVGEGQAVKKGDSLLVLEAMKMENILKSPSDGIIKKVVATKGTAVEKNQLLIQF